MNRIIKWFVLWKARSSIKGLIKNERLVFVNGDKVRYTNKNGDTQRLTFQGMANIYLESMGGQYLGTIDLIGDDFKKVLDSEYKKYKGVK